MDMNVARTDIKTHNSVSSEESALDIESNICSNRSLHESSPPLLKAIASGGQLSDSNAAYFSWPSCRITDGAEDRANYFGNLQKGILPEIHGRLPTGVRATTLLELMTIRSFHSKLLRQFSLGTAIGFRIKNGALTNIPAILVFVARKVHRRWLSSADILPTALEGPGGVWCDVDVVEFCYYGVPAATPKKQFYTELVDAFGGGDPYLGSGSQVASQETYGTLGAIVQSRTRNRQVGFLTNRHVAVDLDFPSQKMFHPLPPSLGPGVYLGAVERATSFIADNLWYGIFAGTNPETFVRADGAFIPFAEDFDITSVTTLVKGIGEIGNVSMIDLQSPIGSLVGRRVVKVGRSSGFTAGTIMAYSLEYNDQKGICFLTDFLVVGENQQTFDLEGDSGSLILLTNKNGEKPRPVGIIWGGTANRGRLKLKVGQPPVNWTSGVDLGRLLDLLELDLITSDEGLHDAVHEQILASAPASSTLLEPVDMNCAYEEENFNPPAAASMTPVSASDLVTPTRLNEFHIQGAHTGDLETPMGLNEFHIQGVSRAIPTVEHQFIPNLNLEDESQQQGERVSPENGSMDESEGEICVSLQLGEPNPKRRK